MKHCDKWDRRRQTTPFNFSTPFWILWFIKTGGVDTFGGVELTRGPTILGKSLRRRWLKMCSRSRSAKEWNSKHKRFYKTNGLVRFFFLTFIEKYSYLIRYHVSNWWNGKYTSFITFFYVHKNRIFFLDNYFRKNPSK